jgi:hypothetical protein
MPFPLLNPRIVSRLRQLFNFRRTYSDDPVVEAVVVVNDDYTGSPTIIREASSAAAGTTALYTIGDTENFWLHNIYLAGVATTLQESVDFRVQATIDGAVRTLALIFDTTNAAFNLAVTRNFDRPLLIDRGTTINLVQGAGATPGSCFASIAGYGDKSGTGE